jgi:hypothetical protein
MNLDDSFAALADWNLGRLRDAYPGWEIAEETMPDKTVRLVATRTGRGVLYARDIAALRLLLERQ